MELTDENLKEIFSLYTSATKYERDQTYERGCTHCFEKVDLSKEYSLTEESGEIARDAWRAVIYFLKKNGYSLHLKGEQIDLSFIEEEFI